MIGDHDGAAQVPQFLGILDVEADDAQGTRSRDERGEAVMHDSHGAAAAAARGHRKQKECGEYDQRKEETADGEARP
ncbi:hypothetical protein PanNE5_34820 [Pandoraea sp. NE5]|nr:hypothetical protein PanNE5_34820 [Pandoraea sp. NE5]